MLKRGKSLLRKERATKYTQHALSFSLLHTLSLSLFLSVFLPRRSRHEGNTLLFVAFEDEKSDFRSLIHEEKKKKDRDSLIVK